MKLFQHYNVDSVEEAATILEKYKGQARVVAGGTDILGTLKNEIHQSYPEALVNLKRIKGLDYIEDGKEGLRIGAMTRVRTIAGSLFVGDKYGLLADAAKAVASPAIRSMATIGGNICQEPRCWYYRHPENVFYCHRKGGQNCNALTGENRYHSIFGAVRAGKTPCTLECPASIDIPGYLNKIREGDLSGAAEILLQYNPMPAVTGRVCPHFCQNICSRGIFDDSVSVRCAERFMGDYTLERQEEFYKAPQFKSGKCVAVLGSGPAGLAAAYFLRKKGHKVVVYERMEEAGGMLMYGIPPYRLSKDVVRKQVAAFKKMGITIRTGVNVGKDITFEELRDSFDGLFLASGAWVSKSLGISGEESLTHGIDFLKDVNQGSRGIPGKSILVIGGGNVAVDVAQTALRLGAKDVTLACLEDRKDMPAFEWEIEDAIREGVKVMNSWGPSQLKVNGGKSSGMELVKCISVLDNTGKFSPVFDYGFKTMVSADKIILAIGQQADLSFLDLSSDVEESKGLIAINSENCFTGIADVFAGGDVASGPSTIVEAIASGNRAATAMDRQLQGQEVSGNLQDGESDYTLEPFSPACLEKSLPCKEPLQPQETRTMDVEDTLTLNLSDIQEEASRCYNCGCVASSPSDIGIALVALDARIQTTQRTISAEKFFAAGQGKSTVLYGDEIVTEIQIPAAAHQNRQSFHKFRIRNAIDFPVLSVASFIKMDSGKVSFARIALGAVAPVPIRAREAEEFLKGREINQETVEEAVNLTLQKAIPLLGNAYKIKVARALIKKALLPQE